MDNVPDNSIYKERQFFFSKLKRNPIFLLRHTVSFSRIISSQLQTKIFTQLFGKHRGHKKRPPWLKNHIKKFKKNEPIDFNHLLNRIPQRNKLTTVCFANQNIINSCQQIDPEDYLAEHRWGILINNCLFESNPDNHPYKLPAFVKKWLNDAPQKKDLAWETYSTCERVANLLTWISFIPKIERRANVPEVIVNFLQESIQWIISHLEFYGKRTGNHILNNARALIMAGTVLENQFAIEIGLEIFRTMLPILIDPVGFLRERSSHYQLIVLLWLLDAYRFLECNSCVSAEKIKFLLETIQSMCKASSHFCNLQGYLTIFIGDISPDMTPITTCARLIACYPDDWPLKGKILLRDKIDWYFLNDKSNKVILNCPKGRFPKQFSSHAHGDLTSFVWTHNDEPILIDAGRSRYTKDPISILQKSALGHNVALVNNFAPLCESLVCNGNWWPLPYAKATITVTLNKNKIEIMHNGYQRATAVTRHLREIEVFKDGIYIRDQFLGKGQADINLLWQLHPAFTKLDLETMTVSNGKQLLIIEPNDIADNVEIKFLDSHPNIGWHSTQYGQAKQHPVLSLRYFVRLPFESKLKFRIKPCAV